MLFASVSFLYYVLPIVLIIYYAVPRQHKNVILLLASLFFYFQGEPAYWLLLVFAALSGYGHGLWIARARGTRRLALASSVLFSLAPLLLIKYTGLFGSSLSSLFRNGALAGTILPLGIGIYTLQVLSYILDLYRGRVQVQRRFLDFALYACLFPQLTAGPIVRYCTVEAELSSRTHSLKDFASGARSFILGLAKVVVLANTLAELDFILQNLEQRTVLLFWVVAIAFPLQLYFTLSGYSDMAIGLGRIFGLHFPENFSYPYAAGSIVQFWGRWLTALGGWFREYIYLPVGGGSRAKQMGLMLATGLFFGLGHGPRWGSIVWGVALAVLAALEKLLLKSGLDKLPRGVRHLYVLTFVVLGFVLFRAESIPAAAESFRAMFGLLSLPWTSPVTNYILSSYAVAILAAALAATPLPAAMAARIRRGSTGAKLVNLLEPLYLIGLLLLASAYLVEGVGPFTALF